MSFTFVSGGEGGFINDTRHCRISPTLKVFRPLSAKQCAETSLSHASKTGRFCKQPELPRKIWKEAQIRVERRQDRRGVAYRLVELQTRLHSPTDLV